ncbi:hypothetical protein FPV67DRAFT_1094497 [Lyophyllum atratum]|nr:hypothetical protein FPV67DRAFT_1094497 [Lyophyllum atratum]
MAPIPTALGPTTNQEETNPSLSESETNKPGRKRRRTKQAPEISTELGRCLFDKLPFELLAEILIFTKSPKDVLAVARCSRFLCATLLNPSSPFIWKAVRNAYPVPPPEPMSIFTEASYAAFLFDGGTCEACGKMTDEMYRSFGLRLRLCRDPGCLTRYTQGGDLRSVDRPLFHEKMIEKCLPHAETYGCFLPMRVGDRPRALYRAKDWLRELHDSCVKPEDYLARNKNKVSYTAEYNKFSMRLYAWKELWQVAYRRNEKANELFAKELAETYSWDYWDMMNTVSYGALHRHKCRRIENVTQEDYDLVAPEVEKALAKLRETRERKTREAAYLKNRGDVAQHYQRLRSQQPPIILPSLPVFRRLPIVRMLQGHSPETIDHPSDVATTLKKENWVAARVDVELKRWTMQARKDLGAVLGYQDWSTARTNVLHPVDRITARFLCKVCSKVAIRYRDDDCLDFSGACAHQCRGTKKDKRQDEVWKAERFVKDDKAIAVLNKLLGLCKVDASLDGAAGEIAALGTTILCISCEVGIFLNSKTIIGHSHRHENMEIKLVSEEEAKAYFAHALVPSLVRTLTGLELRVKAMREWWNYGCRHCFNAELKSREAAKGDGAVPLAVVVGGDDKSKPRGRRPKEEKTRFTFNGLWSHLKTKHGVDEPRDEDVFVFDPISDFKVVSSK